MDLMAVLSKNYPKVLAHIEGTDLTYGNIVWEGGDPLPSEADLMAAYVKDVKESKIDELSAACAKAIISGFASDALGSPHLYDSEAVDQLNLVGNLIDTMPDELHPSGSTTRHAVRPIVNGAPQLKEYAIHTNAQLKKVISDGVAFKLSKLTRFNDMRNDILTNTTRTDEEINAITWESGIPGVVA